MVGGLAVVLHGHARLTADVDLVLDREPGAARIAAEALGALGLQPVAPVALAEFVDLVKRAVRPVDESDIEALGEDPGWDTEERTR